MVVNIKIYVSFNVAFGVIYNVSYHPQKGYVTLILFLTTILVLDTKFLFYVPLLFFYQVLIYSLSNINYSIICHSSLLLPQTMDYFKTHGGYDKDIKYLEKISF